MKVETAEVNCTNNSTLVIKKLQDQIKLQQEQLEHAAHDMETMRKGFQKLLEKDDKKHDGRSEKVTCVSSVSLKADEGYFDSYAHFGIHHEMLSVCAIKKKKIVYHLATKFL